MAGCPSVPPHLSAAGEEPAAELPPDCRDRPSPLLQGLCPNLQDPILKFTKLYHEVTPLLQFQSRPPWPDLF